MSDRFSELQEIDNKSIKHWECPNCKFRVSRHEFMLIKFEPQCRCGIRWQDFLPKFINEKPYAGRTPTNPKE